MLNTYLNVAISLVEGRPRAAREILRSSPDFTGPSVARLQAAIAVRVEQEVNSKLHQLLGKSLAIPVGSIGHDYDSVVAGVKAVEDIIEGEITDSATGNALPDDADRDAARYRMS